MGPCFGKHFIPDIPDNRFRYNTEGHPKNYNDGSYGRFVSAPLYPQVISWLYTKGIDISAPISTSGRFSYEIRTSEGASGWKREMGVYGFDTKYQAYNKAIEEALKLI